MTAAALQPKMRSAPPPTRQWHPSAVAQRAAASVPISHKKIDLDKVAYRVVFEKGYSTSDEFQEVFSALNEQEHFALTASYDKYQGYQVALERAAKLADAAVPASGAAKQESAAGVAVGTVAAAPAAAAPLVLVSAEPTGIDPAALAGVVKAAMDARKDDATKTCYASIGTSHSSHSSGPMTFSGVSIGGGPTMHAERNAMRKVCDHYGVVYGAGDSKAIGQALAAKGVTISWIYTDLPPCPTACEGWVKPLGAKAIYFAETLVNWYSKSPHVKSEAKQWEDFLKSIGKA